MNIANGMKKLNIRYLCLYLQMCLPGLVCGEVCDTVIVLHSDKTGADCEYVARDYILMANGFLYTSDDAHSLCASLDNRIVVSPAGQTYKTANGLLLADASVGYAVGAIAGQFAVSPTGAAVYTLPFELPEGINDVRPELSLVYSSQTGNGIAGWGWNISGQSSITRVGHDMYHDHLCSSVLWNSFDALVLDGQRMAPGSLIPSSNSEYHLEADPSVSIREIKDGTARYFVVRTKDGRTLYYGETEKTRYRLANSSKTYSWLLSRVVDPNGNYIRYNYTMLPNNGECYLHSIVYTGNEQTGTTPADSVCFDYELRADVSTWYVSGKQAMMTRRLKTVKVYTESELLHTYVLAYDNGEANYSRLTDVTLVSKEGEKLPPLAFEWTSPLRYHTKKQSTTFYKINNCLQPEQENDAIYESLSNYDINGDGRSDMIILSSWKHKIAVYFLDVLGQKIDSAVIGLHSDDTIKEVYVGDFNGSGYGDIAVLLKRKKTRTAYLYTFNGHSFDLAKSVSTKHIVLGDFDGDGLSELLTDTQLIEADDTVTLTSSIDYGKRSHASFSNNRNQIDFNGDGKTDLMVLDATGCRIYTLFGNAFTQLYTDTFPNDDTGNGVYFGDFNGDGKTDFLSQQLVADGYSYTVHISTGTGFEAYKIQGIGNFYATPFVGDFNGDGRSDVAFMGFNHVERDGLTGQKIRTVFWGVSTLISDYYQIADMTERDYYDSDMMFYVGFSNGTTFDFEELNSGLDASYTYGLLNSIAGDVDGDGIDELLMNVGDFVHINKFCQPSDGRLLTSIKSTFGQRTDINYAYTAQSSVYQAFYTPKPTFPLTQMNGTLCVVSSAKQTAGSFSSQTKYRYRGGLIHRQGRGFLGFQRVEAYNLENNTTTYTTYLTDTTYYVQLPQSSVTVAGGLIQSQVKENYSLVSRGGYRYQPLLEHHTETDNLQDLTVQTDYTYDTWGNPTQVKTAKGNVVETTETAYGTFGSWCANKPIRQITSWAENGLVLSRLSKYDYDSIGNIETTVLDSGDVNSLVTTYTYDTFGHVLNTATTANGNTRATSRTYSSDGRFLLSETDVLGQQTSYKYNTLTGLLVSKEEAVGVTTYSYDAFGRVVRTHTPDGLYITYGLQWAAPGDLDTAFYKDVSYYAYKQTSGQSPQWTWYDLMGREVCSQDIGLNGRKRSVCRQYDSKGRLWRVSDPTFDSVPQQWAQTTTYDAQGRMSKVIAPVGMTSYSYGSRTITQTSPEETRSTTVDAAGRKLKSTVNGMVVEYTYYPNGLTATTTPENGSPLTMKYDLQGNRTELLDPDAGTIHAAYNGFGDCLWQSRPMHNDCDSVLTCYSYAPSTGQLQQTSVTGHNTSITTYTYHPVFKNLPLSVEQTGGLRRDYVYDALGRLVSRSEKIDGRQMDFSYTYDRLGRVATETYPSGYTVTNTYDRYSHLTAVADADGRDIWSSPKEDAYGRLTEETRGGYTTEYGYDRIGRPLWIGNDFVFWQYEYDERGNLAWRTDGGNHVEMMEYDAQNRLVHWWNSDGGDYQIDYSAVDGLAEMVKTDVGDEFAYDDSEHFHAPTSFNSYEGCLPQQEISYTDFGKVENIIQDDYAYTLTYGIDRQRVKSVYSSGGTPFLTRYYAGNYEEEYDHEQGQTRRLHWLHGGAVYVEWSTENNPNDTWGELLYTYADAQGSIVAVVDEEGNLVDRMAYDPWGRRRNPDNWTEWDERTDPRDFVLVRGYTGHEHLDLFGLTDMNGRVYDPMTGTFLSPDLYIQSPDNWLNYNRYSYCYGNPFKYTDPSGASAFLSALLFSSIICGVSNWVAHGAHISWGGLGHFAVGAMSGAIGVSVGTGVTSALCGGSFVGGLIGTNEAMTAIGAHLNYSFLNGLSIGSAGAFASSYTMSLGNDLLDGNGLWTAMGQAMLDGVKSAAIGGLVSGTFMGVAAMLQGQRFWDGATVIKIVDEQYLPNVKQSTAQNCLPACIESIDKANGGSLTQTKVGSWFNRINPDIQTMVDGDVVDKYCLEYGHIKVPVVFSENNDNANYALLRNYFRSGHRILLTLEVDDNKYHSVVLQKMMYKIILRNGTISSKYFFYLMNPDRNGIGRISLNEVINASNLFIIR